MKLSQSFTKTTKTAPADETSRSAKYLLRAGYIYKEMAGVYDYLPLGMRTLEKIIQVIREDERHRRRRTPLDGFATKRRLGRERSLERRRNGCLV